MRRRRKKRSQLSVSLFPFLAVLICTLGVLIVMLVMAVKSADDQANKVQSEDDAEKQALLEQVEESLTLREIQIEGALSVRPDALDRMRLARNNRSYLEDEIRKLKREFESVGEQLVELDRQSNVEPQDVPDFSDSESNELLESLNQKLTTAKKELEEKRELLGDVNPTTYVIVPHKGGGGTFRRPIYVECTKDAITLQPSGIRLNKSEFVPPLSPGNMLDAALLANREYWNRYDLAGKEGNPYPLLVVRPDGAETFVLARRAMKSWDDEFGYELVDDEKELSFGQSDLQLESELRAAIEVARRRQQAQVATQKRLRRREAQLAGFSSSTKRPGLTASGRYGGFVTTAGGESGTGVGGANQTNEFVPSSDSSQSGQHSAETGESTRENQMASNAKSTNANESGGTGGDMSLRNPYTELSMAKQRGANWALPSQTPGATGYLRPVRVHCGANAIELSAANGQTKTLRIHSSAAEVIDPLVDEIWKKIDSWGISGANSYWKPQLRITVLPGGETRFEELKGLLYQSGLLVEKFQQ
jgi:hypothetical protein